MDASQAAYGDSRYAYSFDKVLPTAPGEVEVVLATALTAAGLTRLKLPGKLHGGWPLPQTRRFGENAYNCEHPCNWVANVPAGGNYTLLPPASCCM